MSWPEYMRGEIVLDPSHASMPLRSQRPSSVQAGAVYLEHATLVASTISIAYLRVLPGKLKLSGSRSSSISLYPRHPSLGGAVVIWRADENVPVSSSALVGRRIGCRWSSRTLRKRYWGRHFWARGYFSTTSGGGSGAKCNTLGRSGSPRKDRIFPSSPPPSAAFRRCEGGSEERKIE